MRSWAKMIMFRWEQNEIGPGTPYPIPASSKPFELIVLLWVTLKVKLLKEELPGDRKQPLHRPIQIPLQSTRDWKVKMLKFKAFCLDYWQFLCLQPLHGAYKRLQEKLTHEAAAHQKLICVSAGDELGPQLQHLPQFALAVWVYGLFEKLFDG
ncbi:MAP/microtubule affinity-regulating kinase 4-like protein [Cricetulus griseus]|nr:MAP/microtubule affinity-regulating kinase 4-like protein [Cricetulus griseus]